MSEGERKFSLNAWIEHYRLLIGGGLFVLILVGAGILLYRENYSRPQLESRIMNLESKIKELESNNQETSSNNQLSSNYLNPNIQNTSPKLQDQGQVAGVDTQNQESKPSDLAQGGQSQDNGTKNTAPKGKINLNSASIAELDSLPGIGPVYAQRIIDYRNANSGFKSIDEVKNVKGIGDKTFEKFKDLVCL